MAEQHQHRVAAWSPCVNSCVERVNLREGGGCGEACVNEGGAAEQVCVSAPLLKQSRTAMLALLLPSALSFELSLVRSRLTAQTSHSPSSIVMKTEALPDSPADLDEGSCYLIDTDEGFVPHPLTQPASQCTHYALSWPGRRKYVCTDTPQELAWIVC